ncbi:MAG: presenilin family intramembrane aspartyl protease [Candidatus Parvarchaeota archaeon]|nr:presenilin family intramembrane aspartyl protease [Candidatus Rehaiarchaeum fermentans]
MKKRYETVFELIGVFIILFLLTYLITYEYRKLALPSNFTYSNSYVIYYIFSLVGIIILTSYIINFLYSKNKKANYIPNLFLLIRAIIILSFFSIFLNIIISFALTLILLYYEKKSMILANFNNIIIAAYVAATLGIIIGIVGTELLLGIIAVYDFVSVYLTDHMIKLIKPFKERIEYLGIVLQAGSKREGKKTFRFLGLGDLAFSNILISSILFYTNLISLAFLEEIIAIFALTLIFFFGKKRRGHPAMAYIAPLQLIITNIILFFVI